MTVMVRFEGEGEVKKMDPLKSLEGILEKYDRVLGDGNLLIGCSSQEQMGKAKKMIDIGNIKISKVVRVGEQRSSRCTGVISGVPITVSMQSLVENMRVQNRSVKSAKRMKRGAEKRGTETILIEFDTKVLPEEIFFGVMKYSVREFMPKPMRCYNWQEFGHIAKMCKGKRRCARCGGEHEYGKCGDGVRPKCCNCGGNFILHIHKKFHMVQMKNQRKETEYNKEQLAVVGNQYK